MATRSYQLFLGQLLAPILLGCSVKCSLMQGADVLWSRGDVGGSGAVGLSLVSRAGDAEQPLEIPPALG